LVVDEPDRAGFDWAHPFGAKVIGDVLAATKPLVLIQETRTPLYRVQLFRSGNACGPPNVTVLPHQPSPLPAEVERHVLWRGGALRTSDAGAQPCTASLPILLYHRIASAVGSRLNRYCVTPDDFEAQLRYLRDCGYYSVTLATWRDAMAAHSPLPGRAVLLTFDDGYRDFAECAWPLLKRYGFSALVFLVADEIGGTSRWDRSSGETAPLLGWTEIHGLQQAGVAFGCHTSTHPRLTALSPTDVVKELASSRSILTRGLRAPIDALAYPYGAEDPVVHHLAGATGFTFGLTCRSGRTGLWEAPLKLPRIEVRGDQGFVEFVRALGD
jgi:peptidoglycan/xylan/chitin deacetylase (PgdA/CDA1 family)